jgi:Flp pilus assembly protein TadD
VGLGRSYSGVGQYQHAEQALIDASKRKPRDAYILLDLGRTQLAAGKAQAGLATLDQAQALRPRDLAIITARGAALDRLSRHQEAQKVYRSGLDIDPTDFALLSNLTLSPGLSGQTDEGIRILRELVRDASASPKTRSNLALV